MIARVLIDNNAELPFCGEWGLSILIEYNGKKILLDSGTTGAFVDNAEKMGIDLNTVDICVLSHAHYDHSDGFGRFFEKNQHAKVLIRNGASENCYSKKSGIYTYIGIKKGSLEKYCNRIEYVSGDFEVYPGAWLIPHKTENLKKIGKHAGMYRRNGNSWITDDFSHEQSLVLDTEIGLVIFNSCSHGGADNIINEVSRTFPDKKIYAMIGGFHLFRSTKNEVESFADRVKATGIEKIVTGHCTGEEAFAILKEKLGCKVEGMYSGYTFEI